MGIFNRLISRGYHELFGPSKKLNPETMMDVWWGNRIVNHEKHRITIVAKNAVLRGPTIQKMLVFSQNYIVRLFFCSSTMVFHGASIYFSGALWWLTVFSTCFAIFYPMVSIWFPHFMNPQPSTPSGWSTWHQGVVTRPQEAPWHAGTRTWKNFCCSTLW
jgi:hypothetical protein